MSGSGRESSDARRTVVLAAVVRGAVALKLVFMQCRRVGAFRLRCGRAVGEG